nr:Hypothetical protein [Cloning vector pMUT13]
MLVMLAAWGISWGARFVMEQAVLLYGSGKNYLFFSHGTVLMYLLCVFLVYRRWIAPLPVVGQLRNVGVPWLVGAMAVVYVGVFLLGKAPPPADNPPATQPRHAAAYRRSGVRCRAG